MAEQVLMEKAGERMNVPGEKVDAFLEDGWIVIERQGLGPEQDAEPVEDSEPKPRTATRRQKTKGEAEN